jgi:hypothetical protein
MFIGSLSWTKRDRGLMLTTQPHLAPRLKKEFTSTPPVALCGLFHDEIYLYLFTEGKENLREQTVGESHQSFIHQQMHHLLILETSKIYIKIYIKIAPTCFGPRPSSGSVQLSLAKATRMLKQSVKLSCYVLCGGVAA